jgi:chemotaxis protein CheX
VNAFKPAVAPGAGRECWLPTLELAAQEVFGLMLDCTLQVPQETPEEHGLDITAMVGLAGEVCGILTARCSRKSAARMASRMLHTDADESGGQVWDAVGEICNMIAGNFKNKISGLGEGCLLSVPTIIKGQDYSLYSMSKQEFRTVLLFETEPVVFCLEIHH